MLVATLPFVTGCNLTKLIAFNVLNEPHNTATHNQLKARAERFARDAWLDHFATLPDNCPPEAYEDGFLDGYADFLLKGGNGNPPALPPPQYRRTDGASPQGHLEIKAYYVGFAAGAAAAKASGLRGYFLIPLSTPLARNELPTPDQISSGQDSAPAPQETLPPPSPSPSKDVPIVPKKAVEPMQSRNPSSEPGAAPASASKSIAAVAPKPQLDANDEDATDHAPQIRPATVERKRAPATAAPVISESATNGADVPREFSVPILGGAASR